MIPLPDDFYLHTRSDLIRRLIKEHDIINSKF
jgi:hypothetical protein